VSRSSSVYTSCKPTGSFRVVDGDGKQAEIKNADGIVSPASEKVDAWTYVFGKPGELDRDLARLGTSRQRFLRINLTALLFALATNFLGLTSALLSLLPDLQGLYVIPADLTLFFPVKGWKRYTGEGAFELIYPGNRSLRPHTRVAICYIYNITNLAQYPQYSGWQTRR
jgi:hypothetical protein